MLLLIFAAITNPDINAHRRAIDARFDKEHPVAKWFGIGNIASMQVTYHNYAVVSVTTYDREVVTVGAVGQVVFVNQ
jgi:hypothetical protein